MDQKINKLNRLNVLNEFNGVRALREIYIDIMDKSLSAYTQQRIDEYVRDVRENGLTEHGFPRLAANIGILIALGRRRELVQHFIEMMDLCCDQIPRKKAANDFSIKEICFALMLLGEKHALDNALIEKWRNQLRAFNPWKGYNIIAESPDTPVNNWAAYGAASEYMRMLFCGVDSSDFVDLQVSSQLLSFDENGMYRDPNNPMVYDIVTRVQLALLLRFGYTGKLADEIRMNLDKSAELTLKMQSVTGEMPYGGRSNQMLFNEAYLAAVLEYYATTTAERGDIKNAAIYKAAALNAANALLKWLSLTPISHVKNRYDADSLIGCEDYAYFNKYMITVASMAYAAYLLADDGIDAADAPVPAENCYLAQTGPDFHKVFVRAADYFLEFDTNADPHYDANGLGRVHKKGCPSAICLSVPFARDPKYKTEGENSSAMSICGYAIHEGRYLIGAEPTSTYRLTETRNNGDSIDFEFECRLSEEVSLTEKYHVSRKGVDITLSGHDNVGFMVPVFEFDGYNTTTISLDKNSIRVEYGDSRCIYSFPGELSNEYKHYYNRNGRYRVYAISGNNLHIEIEKISGETLFLQDA